MSFLHTHPSLEKKSTCTNLASPSGIPIHDQLVETIKIKEPKIDVQMTNHGFKLNGRSSDCGLPQQSVPLDAMVVDILITYCQSKTPEV